MNSQELVHLHGLLYEVRLYLEGKECISPAAFVRYDVNGVRPNHIHRGKEAHERAIELLLAGFARSTEARRPERPTTL